VSPYSLANPSVYVPVVVVAVVLPPFNGEVVVIVILVTPLSGVFQAPVLSKYVPLAVPSKAKEALAILLLSLASVITNLSPLAIVTSSVYNVPLFVILPKDRF
jgi:hypothetical protein